MATPAIDRVLARVERIPFSGCWIFMGALNDADYGIVGLGARGTGVDRAHRIIFRHFVGQITDGLIVCHRCDVPSCCNPDHLFLGTHADNRADCDKKGRSTNPPRNQHLRGERHYAAKFSAEQVANFRAEMSEGVTATFIAKREGVTHGCLAKIRSRTRWA